MSSCDPFDAFLPNRQEPIRITCLHDAQVFARRWAIRDKDPALKALVRRLDRVDGGQSATKALYELHGALASRGMLTRANSV